MVALLSINFVGFAFLIQPTSSQPKSPVTLVYTPKQQDLETALWPDSESASKRFAYAEASGKLDLRNKEELQRFAWCDQDSVNLIVGTDLPKEQTHKLEEAISSGGGKIIGTLSIGETVKAISAKVSLNQAYLFAEKLRTSKLVKYVEANIKIEPDFTPNDPSWLEQWGPKKIQADWAWNITTGSASVLVAVIDTGIDYNHSELVANYVPLGYDWINNDTNPMDDYWHGTHCAGIIAAQLNNSVGIAGIAQVRIMAEKVLDSTGWGTDFTVAQGIYHATDAGAKIISMSLGCYVNTTVMYEAVKYAYDHGVLLVASAGNDHGNSPHFPSSYNEVISVAATDQDDYPAWFSNYGESIELSAPGVNIYSTFLGNSYYYAEGTSMACPHVSGLAALVWSRFPNFTRDELRHHLQHTADRLAGTSFDEYYGYGRINAKKAVEGLPEHDVELVGWHCPYYIIPGESAIFSALIFGYGKSNETNVSVQLLINGIFTESALIDFLEQSTFTTISFTWNTTMLGWYNVTCRVLPVPGENVTGNNDASTLVLARLPVPITLRVPEDYSKIQTAVYAARSGDTIYVKRGTYHERVMVNKSVSFVGEHMKTTIIDADLRGSVFRIVHDNVSITGFTIQRSGWSTTHAGVYLDHVQYCNIRGNNITDTFFTGVRLYFSSNNSISGNVITANRGHCIYLSDSLNNSIFGNYFVRNAYCILLLCSKFNQIFANSITKNDGCSISLWSSSNNSIVGNKVINNRDGIEVYTSSNNSIYHNNFVNNTNQFNMDSLMNSWDDCFPSGGNYWSSYSGVDMDNDGIGDTPYVLGTNNTDRYPLMKPWNPPAHDVAVTDITFSKTVIGQGYALQINFTVTNQGNYTETFNATLRAGALTLGIFTDITLPNASSIHITFIWNTIDFEKNSYAVIASVNQILGEIDTLNNILYGGVIKVSIPGDITGDFVVDIVDATQIGLNWLQMAPPASANVDINGDGTIDIIDATIIGLNWLKNV